jgi:glutamate---cysteine ligase / carboxylate-amine ligase
MSDRFRLGVEEEYHLVERESGELRSRSRMVLAADRSGAVEGEVQDSMLEIGTPTCGNAAELTQWLKERRFQAATAAAAEDLEVIAAGTHPFSRWQDQELAEGERPRLLSGLFRQVLRQQHICGMHVHVAIPEEHDRVVLMNVVRSYTPHLLALACSSPYQLGEDTGFDSFRSVYWRGFPFTGNPPRFASAEEFDAYLEVLLRAGVIPDKRTVYWSVRPSARYPTLEFRMCDVCPRLEDAVAIASLCRALVVAVVHGRLQPAGSSFPASLQDEILTENEWLAARDGLGATLIAPETADARMPLRRAIGDLLDTVLPVLRDLGDLEVLEGVTRILDRGNASLRMRARYAETGSMRDLVGWLADETRSGTGLDRRREQRDFQPATT